MSELQFVRVEGDFLVMKSGDGVEFQLPVDEVLRGELRQTTSPKPNTSALSPREIQEAIREGASVEELVEKHGADNAYVSKWAQPVLDELQHVVASAQGVRINLAGDRFSDVTQIDFGDLIERRLKATSATDINWSSHRQDQSIWLVTVRFELPQGAGHATWSFDPRKLTLTPENESALSLSSAESLTEGPIPRLRPVTTDQNRHPSTTASQKATAVIPLPKPAVADETSADVAGDSPTNNSTNPLRVVADTIPAVSAELPPESTDVPAEVSANATAEIASRSTIKEAIARASTPVASEPPAPAVEPITPGEVSPDPADLLDALRKKRIERETAVTDELPHKATGASRPLIPLQEPEPVTSSIRIINDEPLVEAEESQLPAIEPEDSVQDATPVTAPVDVIADDQTAKPDTKKGRAGIPSWDEIVFGTKTDD